MTRFEGLESPQKHAFIEATADRPKKADSAIRARAVGRTATCDRRKSPDQHSASCPFTPRSTTLSTFSVISLAAARFAPPERKPSRRGKLRPLPNAEIEFSILRPPSQVPVRMPLPFLETCERRFDPNSDFVQRRIVLRPRSRPPRQSLLSARVETRSQNASTPRPEAVEHIPPQSFLALCPSTSCECRIAWRNAARLDLARCVL